MKILKIVLNGAGGGSILGFALTPHPCLETKLCIFTVPSSSLNFRAYPRLVVGGVCFCELRIKSMYTLFKCVWGLVSTKDSCTFLLRGPGVPP